MGMIKKDAAGNWQLEGVPWESLRNGHVSKAEYECLYSALKKLKDYEALGSPDKIGSKLCELDELREKGAKV